MRRTRALPGSSSLKCRRFRKPFAISAFTAWSSPSTATSDSRRPQEPSTQSTGTLRYFGVRPDVAQQREHLRLVEVHAEADQPEALALELEAGLVAGLHEDQLVA